jgi:hypothetical protein
MSVCDCICGVYWPTTLTLATSQALTRGHLYHENGYYEALSVPNLDRMSPSIFMLRLPLFIVLNGMDDQKSQDLRLLDNH